MAEHLEIGKEGDELAARYLEERRYIILERNWRYRHREIERYLISAANAFMLKKKLDQGVRFDIILLTGETGDFNIEHIEDAFSPWD